MKTSLRSRPRPRSRRPAQFRRADLAAPLRVGFWRAFGEALALAVAIQILGNTVALPGGDAWRWVGGSMAAIWLVCWPAWRLRPLEQRGALARWARGLGRAILLGLLIGLAIALITHPTVGWRDGGVAVSVAFAFVLVRATVVVAARIGCAVRRRLRWQLTLSHLAVIFVTFVTFTAVGSAIAAAVLAQTLQPHAPAAAIADAQALGSLPGVQRTGRLDRAEVQAALSLIADNQVVPRGASPIATLIQPLDGLVQTQVLVLSTNGTLLAWADNPHCGNPADAPAPRLPPAAWRTLRSGALAGQPAVVDVPATACPGLDPRPGTGTRVASAMAIAGKSRAHHPLGVVVVESLLNTFAPRQVATAAVAIFSVATAVLVSIWFVPSLTVSGLFGYFFARGLTRRLESVSRVTTAIAAGDLTQRAPVNAHNEVARLAESVNSMAAGLETAMGELQRARTQAVDALRARQELVASISHELRTPLAIMRAHLDTLALRQATPVGAAGSSGPPAQDPAMAMAMAVPAETLRALQGETERLAALVDDLFALSRAETGALQVRQDVVDLARLVDDVAAAMRPLAQREGMIALIVDAPPGLPPALADADRVRQILANLVRNAVRHTPDGGIIVLSAGADARWVTVSVADTGEGIAPEHLPHVFERFYRVDQARTRSGGGAGLGLAIVRELVELMGGRVTVESKPGEGSCFRVFLPRAAT